MASSASLWVRLESDVDLKAIAEWMPRLRVQSVAMTVQRDLDESLLLARAVPSDLTTAEADMPKDWPRGGAATTVVVFLKPEMVTAIPTLAGLGMSKLLRLNISGFQGEMDLTGLLAAALVQAAASAPELEIEFQEIATWAPKFFDDFAHAAGANVKLHSLRLRFVHDAHSDISDAAASSLAGVLHGHGGLRSFGFRGDASDRAVAGLVESLRKNQHLREMELSGYNGTFGSGTAEALSHLLISHASFASLKLNSFDRDASMTIAHALQHNCSLRLLHLRVADGLSLEIEEREALKNLLEKSFSLVEVSIRASWQHYSKPDLIDCNAMSARNRSLWKQRAALHALAPFNDYGLISLASLSFRNKLLEYFLPRQAAFHSTGNADVVATMAM